MGLVRFVTTTGAGYSGITSKDKDTLYFISDERRIYKGEIPYSGGIFTTIDEFPETGEVNTLYVNSTTGEVRYYNGTSYQIVVPATGKSITGKGDGSLATTAAVAAYVTSQTSSIQTQLNSKAASNHTHSNYLTTTGTAAAASKLATARTISLAGDVTGSANFDGSTNISITSNIAAGTVGTNELASNAVTNVKIAADSVSLAKLGSDVETVAVQSKQPSDTNVRLWIQI